MHLTPRDIDKLILHQAGFLAQNQRRLGEARTTLGGAGITLDHTVMRHMNNLETVMTYEGTEEMHLLSVGADLTGIPAFR